MENSTTSNICHCLEMFCMRRSVSALHFASAQLNGSSESFKFIYFGLSDAIIFGLIS